MSDRPQFIPDAPPQSQGTPSGTSGMAIASFICSLLFFILLLGPMLAIIFGIIALVNISSAKGALGGKGLAIAGVSIGGFFFLMTLCVLPALALPALTRARAYARAAACKSNLKQMGLAVAMYQADNNEEMPPDIQTLLDDGYIKGGMIAYCPASRIMAVNEANLDATASYHYAQIKKTKDYNLLRNLPIMWDKNIVHPDEFVNVLYADMHVEATPVDLLEAILTQDAEHYLSVPPLPAANGYQE